MTVEKYFFCPLAACGLRNFWMWQANSGGALGHRPVYLKTYVVPRLMVSPGTFASDSHRFTM